MRLLLRVAVAAGCAALAFFAFEIGAGFGETPYGAPLGWRIILDSAVGAIVLTGTGLGYVGEGFPWLELLSIPPMIRAFMLRPYQLELYSIALTLGAYVDCLFLLGAAIGIAVRRWRWRRRGMPS